MSSARLARILEYLTLVILLALPVVVVVRLVQVPPIPANASLLYPQHAVAAELGPVAFGLALLTSAIVLVLIAVALLTLWRLLTTIRRGAALTLTAARQMRRFGVCLLVLAAVMPVMQMAQSVLLSFAAPEGERQVSLLIGSSEIGFLLAGGVMTLVGWAMADAARIAEENRGFV